MRRTRASREIARDREEEVFKKSFLQRLASASSFEELERLANSAPASVHIVGDRLRHWLGCALHGNPFDAAPEDVKTAIREALARVTRNGGV